MKKVVLKFIPILFGLSLSSCFGGCNNTDNPSVNPSTTSDNTSTTSQTTSESDTSTTSETTSETTSNNTSTHEEVVLVSISLSGTPKTNFVVNDTFTYEGLIVTANYSVGDSKEVTNYTVNPPEMTSLGQKDVLVSYTENNVTKTNSYKITVSGNATIEDKELAIKEIRDAFNELDIEEYSEARWERIVEKLNDAIRRIYAAESKSEIEEIKNEAITFFVNSPRASEITKGTLFDYHSADSNYQFDRDDDNNLVITYDGYPGHWVYCGTKTALITDVTKDNLFSLTFRNDIDEGIEVCLQLTDDSGAYKLDTGITNIAAHETKTLTLAYDINVTRLYFFIDSCSVHSRVGKVTILNTELSYEDRTPSQIFEPKVLPIEQAIVKSTAGAKYTLLAEDQAIYIERVDVMMQVSYNGNDNGHQWFGFKLAAGSNSVTLSESQGHAQEIKQDGVTVGSKIIFNLPIDEAKKLTTGAEISSTITYGADNLTYQVLSYSLYYTLWTEVVTETVEVNQEIYTNGAASGKAQIAYSSFLKQGRVSKMDIHFTTINGETYGKSQIYLTNFQFTDFGSGNNNVINIGKQMATVTQDEKEAGVTKEATGSISIYPKASIDLSKDKVMTLECWWASAVMVRIDSITMYTDNVEAPSEVTNLEAHPIDSGMVLTWSRAQNATSYDVYVNDVLKTSVNATYATINELTNGTSYTFKVIAKNASGSSEPMTVTASPVEGAVYDTFIEGLNTSLEELIGESNMGKFLTKGAYYLDQCNYGRLNRVINKMKNGEATTVAFMGGSITVGETASLKDENHHAKGYAYYTYQWLKRTYDVQNKSKFVNGSISGTGSEIGIVRVQEDVLDHNPDLVFIEFAANNGSTDFYKQSYESLIRKCMAQDNDPAIVLVFSCTSYTKNGSEFNYMSQIGNHYQLPMFSMQRAMNEVCTVFDQGRTDPIFHAFSDDATHPNDEGHQLMAKGLAYYLREALKNYGTQEANEYPTGPSISGYDKYDALVKLDNTNSDSVVKSLGSFAKANTATSCTRDQSDVTAFQKGWKKTDTTSNDALVLEVEAKNFIVIYEAGNKSVSGDPTGNIVVTYTNKANPSDTKTLTWDVSKTCKQNNSADMDTITAGGNGWQNPCGILIFDKTSAATYEISISMENASGICTIMAFGYTKQYKLEFMAVTIYDIAKRCNCSTATVSKVLNHAGRISKEKRKEILDVCKELGYVGSESARALASNSRSSHLIGVLLHINEDKSITHELFSGILNSFRVKMEEEGYDICLLRHISDDDTIDYSSLIASRGINGVFILSTSDDERKAVELINEDIPTVGFDIDRSKYNVVSNNKESVAELVDYLVSLGHTRFAYVTPGNHGVALERLNGFKLGLERNNIKFDERMVINAPYYCEESAKIATDKALGSPLKPTVIMYPDDYTAISAIPYLRSLGYKVPKDISITGFDGIEVASVMRPSITTIKQNQTLLGEEAATMLLKLINKEEIIETTKIIDSSIVRGESTQKIN